MTFTPILSPTPPSLIFIALPALATRDDLKNATEKFLSRRPMDGPVSNSIDLPGMQGNLRPTSEVPIPGLTQPGPPEMTVTCGTATVTEDETNVEKNHQTEMQLSLRNRCEKKRRHWET